MAIAFVGENHQNNSFSGPATSVIVGNTAAAGSNTGLFTANNILLTFLAIETVNTITPPAGWTQAATPINYSGYTYGCWWHLCNGSEDPIGSPSGFTFTFPSSFYAWTMASYSGCNTSTPIDAIQIAMQNNTGGGTTQNTGSITLNNAGDVVVLHGINSGSPGLAKPGAMTSRLTNTQQEVGTAEAFFADQSPGAGSFSTTYTIPTNIVDNAWSLVGLLPSGGAAPATVGTLMLMGV
jgi:hypothetical protein